MWGFPMVVALASALACREGTATEASPVVPEVCEWEAVRHGREMDFEVDWHPNLNKILFTHIPAASNETDGWGGPQVRVYDLDSGTNRFLAWGHQASWAPDGTSVALRIRTAGESQIGVLDLESGDLRVVTEGGAWKGFPEFHPLGRELLFAADYAEASGYWLLTLATNELKYLQDGGGRGMWSPDGSLVLAGIGLRVFEAAEPYEFVWEHVFPGPVLQRQWLPDGGRVAAYVADTRKGVAGVWIVNLATHASELWRKDVLDVAFAPDSTRVVFSANSKEGRHKSVLFISDLKHGHCEQLTREEDYLP